MQLIEASSMGVRAARFVLSSPNCPVTITLFPMVHVGEPSFYRAVYEEAFNNDVALVEGVRSPIVKRITRSYRWIEGSRILGLVVQPRAPGQQQVRARIVHADLAPDEFAQVWRTVPIWLRAALFLIAPSIGLWRRFFVTRAILAKDLSCDDQASFDELVGLSPESIALTGALLDARDERLLERLREALDAPRDGERSVAIVYGAMHMRAVLRELSRRGFVPTPGDWLTIFSL
jgi:hypothetical protein